MITTTSPFEFNAAKTWLFIALISSTGVAEKKLTLPADVDQT